MRIPLPESVKHRLRPLPQWTAVGITQPQPVAEARLLLDGNYVDVTFLSVVAALRPLTIAISVDNHTERSLLRTDKVVLEVFDRDAAQVVGTLLLTRLADPRDFGARIMLFEVLSDQQRCLDWPLRPWNRWMQSRAMRASVKPGNFSMSPAAIHQMMVFYMCPRPVVAVSVDGGLHRNMFPMDLIGPVAADRFALALRSTSPSIEAMKLTGKVAIADFAVEDVQVAYALGAHHKESLSDWRNLPFRVERSSKFELPVPESALRVREIEISTSESIGSHTFFVGQIVSEMVRRSGPQLCHVPGIYQHFRALSGRSLPRAPSG